MRIKPGFRFTIYGAFAVLFTTGAVWLLADQLKDSADGEIWQQISAYLLTVHGGAAMAMLMCFGALVPTHISRAWRVKQNRVTGTASLVLNGLLVATAFGLYYLGSDTVRPWISDVHIAFGLGVPALIFVHIFVGRRAVQSVGRDVRTRAQVTKLKQVTLVPGDSSAEPAGEELAVPSARTARAGAR
jgi:cation transport ATPase